MERNDKRYQVWRMDDDHTKCIAGFDSLSEAHCYLDDICDDYELGDSRGWWFLDFQDAPVLLEIIDWWEQTEPMAVC